MKKILFVSLTGYPTPDSGGSNKVIYEILKHLDYSKFKPSFFSYDLFANYYSPAELIIPQIHSISLKKKFGKYLYSIFPLYRSITSSKIYTNIYYNRIDKYFKKHIYLFKSFDIIHIHNCIAAFYFKSIIDKKLVLTIHSKGSIVPEMIDTSRANKLNSKLVSKLKEKELKGFEVADLITFPSKAAIDLFIRDVMINEELSNKISIIHNGIDINYIKSITPSGIFEKYGIRKSDYELILLNVAAHVAPKNIDVILKAVKVLVEKYKFKTLFINSGSGKLTYALLKLLDDLNINNSVKFLGSIPNSDVIKLMKACDIFLMPSSRVVFDMVVLEALVCNIQILVSNEGGNKEIIKENFNGVFLNTINEFEICSKIIEMKKLNNLPEKKIDQYDVSIMVRKYEDLYEI